MENTFLCPVMTNVQIANFEGQPTAPLLLRREWPAKVGCENQRANLRAFHTFYFIVCVTSLSWFLSCFFFLLFQILAICIIFRRFPKHSALKQPPCCPKESCLQDVPILVEL
jgi:hypothetical protein